MFCQICLSFRFLQIISSCQQMDNKNIQHYRYKTIISQTSPKRKAKNQLSSGAKDKIKDVNQTMTNYRSIRQLRKKIYTNKPTSQKNIENSNIELYPEVKNDLNNKQISHDLMDIVKMKLYKNSPDKSKVKTQMTMNRDQFQHYLKKKPQTQFTMSRSLEQIKNMFPKRIDAFISQLKLKVAQIQRNNQNIKGEQRPNTAFKGKRIFVRNIKRPQTNSSKRTKAPFGQNMTKPTKFMTQYEEGDVSAWETQPIQQDFIRNKPIQQRSFSKPHQ